ncbi:AMP binding protein [Mycena venus]|uniref:AMP binding protein n=1 Tax=Mycena venus TaxID=2733690 RepID=A0A8H7D5J8_9AGAR|nr:AMP binding protein [Mycena venus]
MAPPIYTSSFPDVTIANTSIFTHVLAARAIGDIGGFPGSKRAFIDAATGTSITRAELLNLSLSFGYGIWNHPVTAPFTARGATALIYSPNSLAWPVVLFGCVAAGLRVTVANHAYVGRELAFQYGDSGARLVFTAEEGIETVRAMFSELGIARDEGDRRTVVLGRDLRWAGGPAADLRSECSGLVTLPDLLVRGKLEREEQFDGALAHETAFLCYSSGTTGKPKGVETTHQNMTTILDVCRPLFLEVRSGNGTTLGILPFYHIYGLALLLHLPLTLGWAVIIQSQFDPIQFCAAIERFKVPFPFIVPPVLVVFARHPAVDNYDLSSLQYMLSAAAPLGADLVKQVKTRLLSKRPPGATCSITQGYGLTETTTGTHMLLFRDADRKVGSVGTLCANLEARIVHDEDGTVDTEEGAPGELWVRGKTIMKGYLNNANATTNSITPDGWFKTGDIVVRDKDTFFYVVDRKKELIKYKVCPRRMPGQRHSFIHSLANSTIHHIQGFQVYLSIVPPAELESVLLTHPDIADAAVIGIESREQATELPRCALSLCSTKKILNEIQTVAQKTAFAQGIIKWMESRVAKHKLLRGGVAIVDAVPKSAAGKILRRELRELAKQETTLGEMDAPVRSRL